MMGGLVGHAGRVDWDFDVEIYEMVFLPHPVCGNSSVFGGGEVLR